MKKTCKKYAVHKAGTEMFGCLCSSKTEAEDVLATMHKNAQSMSEEEKSNFNVIEVELSWNED